MKREYFCADCGAKITGKGKTGLCVSCAAKSAWSIERRQEKSKALRGKNNPLWGKKGEKHPAYGYRHTAEFKQRMSVARMGKGNPFYGKKHSLETRPKFAHAGENNPRWKGGRKTHSDGYILLLRPGHPFADKYGYVQEHRLVMEELLDRFLRPEEVVHHINGDPADNRIENLRLFSSNADHLEYHRRQEVRS